MALSFILKYTKYLYDILKYKFKTYDLLVDRPLWLSPEIAALVL